MADNFLEIGIAVSKDMSSDDLKRLLLSMITYNWSSISDNRYYNRSLNTTNFYPPITDYTGKVTERLFCQLLSFYPEVLASYSLDKNIMLKYYQNDIFSNELIMNDETILHDMIDHLLNIIDQSLTDNDKEKRAFNASTVNIRQDLYNSLRTRMINETGILNVILNKLCQDNSSKQKVDKISSVLSIRYVLDKILVNYFMTSDNISNNSLTEQARKSLSSSIGNLSITQLNRVIKFIESDLSKKDLASDLQQTRLLYKKILLAAINNCLSNSNIKLLLEDANMASMMLSVKLSEKDSIVNSMNENVKTIKDIANNLLVIVSKRVNKYFDENNLYHFRVSFKFITDILTEVVNYIKYIAETNVILDSPSEFMNKILLFAQTCINKYSDEVINSAKANPNTIISSFTNQNSSSNSSSLIFKINDCISEIPKLDVKNNFLYKGAIKIIDTNVDDAWKEIGSIFKLLDINVSDNEVNQYIQQYKKKKELAKTILKKRKSAQFYIDNVLPLFDRVFEDFMTTFKKENIPNNLKDVFEFGIRQDEDIIKQRSINLFQEFEKIQECINSDGPNIQANKKVYEDYLKLGSKTSYKEYTKILNDDNQRILESILPISEKYKLWNKYQPLYNIFNKFPVLKNYIDNSGNYDWNNWFINVKGFIIAKKLKTDGQEFINGLENLEKYYIQNTKKKCDGILQNFTQSKYNSYYGDFEWNVLVLSTIETIKHLIENIESYDNFQQYAETKTSDELLHQIILNNYIDFFKKSINDTEDVQVEVNKWIFTNKCENFMDGSGDPFLEVMLNLMEQFNKSIWVPELENKITSHYNELILCFRNIINNTDEKVIRSSAYKLNEGYKQYKNRVTGYFIDYVSNLTSIITKNDSFIVEFGPLFCDKLFNLITKIDNDSDSAITDKNELIIKQKDELNISDDEVEDKVEYYKSKETIDSIKEKGKDEIILCIKFQLYILCDELLMIMIDDPFNKLIDEYGMIFKVLIKCYLKGVKSSADNFKNELYSLMKSSKECGIIINSINNALKELLEDAKTKTNNIIEQNRTTNQNLIDEQISKFDQVRNFITRNLGMYFDSLITTFDKGDLIKKFSTPVRNLFSLQKYLNLRIMPQTLFKINNNNQIWSDDQSGFKDILTNVIASFIKIPEITDVNNVIDKLDARNIHNVVNRVKSTYNTNNIRSAYIPTITIVDCFKRYKLENTIKFVNDNIIDIVVKFMLSNLYSFINSSDDIENAFKYAYICNSDINELKRLIESYYDYSYYYYGELNNNKNANIVNFVSGICNNQVIQTTKDYKELNEKIDKRLFVCARDSEHFSQMCIDEITFNTGYGISKWDNPDFRFPTDVYMQHTECFHSQNILNISNNEDKLKLILGKYLFDRISFFNFDQNQFNNLIYTYFDDDANKWHGDYSKTKILSTLLAYNANGYEELYFYPYRACSVLKPQLIRDLKKKIRITICIDKSLLNDNRYNNTIEQFARIKFGYESTLPLRGLDSICDNIGNLSFNVLIPEQDNCSRGVMKNLLIQNSKSEHLFLVDVNGLCLPLNYLTNLITDSEVGNVLNLVQDRVIGCYEERNGVDSIYTKLEDKPTWCRIFNRERLIDSHLSYSTTLDNDESFMDSAIKKSDNKYCLFKSKENGKINREFFMCLDDYSKKRKVNRFSLDLNSNMIKKRNQQIDNFSQENFTYKELREQKTEPKLYTYIEALSAKVKEFSQIKVNNVNSEDTKQIHDNIDKIFTDVCGIIIHINDEYIYNTDGNEIMIQQECKNVLDNKYLNIFDDSDIMLYKYLLYNLTNDYDINIYKKIMMMENFIYQYRMLLENYCLYVVDFFSVIETESKCIDFLHPDSAMIVHVIEGTDINFFNIFEKDSIKFFDKSFMYKFLSEQKDWFDTQNNNECLFVSCDSYKRASKIVVKDDKFVIQVPSNLIKSDDKYKSGNDYLLPIGVWNELINNESKMNQFYGGESKDLSNENQNTDSRRKFLIGVIIGIILLVVIIIVVVVYVKRNSKSTFKPKKYKSNQINRLNDNESF